MTSRESARSAEKSECPRTILGGLEGLAAVGLDGCRGGWIAIGLSGEGRLAFAGVVETAGQFVETLPGGAVVAIDMPIGLPAAGTRPADVEARRLLPPGRKSSVFPCPPRPLLAARSYPEAQRMSRALDGRGLQKQAWNLFPRIRELDALVGPAEQNRILECHPEVAFQARSGGRALPRKRRPEGRAARLAILADAGLAGLDTLLKDLPRKLAAPDDLLDAAVCALVAQDFRAGLARRVPVAPGLDPRGLRMEIWF